MEKQIVVVRSKKGNINVDLTLPEEIDSIAISEFGWDNNLFNILNDNEIKFYTNDKKGKQDIYSKIIKKGHYEIDDLVKIFESIKIDMSSKNLIKNDESVALWFYKPTLKFAIRNKTKNLYIEFPEELQNFLCFPSNIIEPNTKIYSDKYFSNSPSRLILVKCNEIKYGEILINSDDDNDVMITNKNSKVMLSYAIESEFGQVDKRVIKDPQFYKTTFLNEKNISFKITITDEFGNVFDYVDNFNFYIKFIILMK